MADFATVFAFCDAASSPGGDRLFRPFAAYWIFLIFQGFSIKAEAQGGPHFSLMGLVQDNSVFLQLFGNRVRRMAQIIRLDTRWKDLEQRRTKKQKLMHLRMVAGPNGDKHVKKWRKTWHFLATISEKRGVPC